MDCSISEAHKRAHYGEAGLTGRHLVRWGALFLLALPPLFASPSLLTVNAPNINEPPNDNYVVNPADLHMEVNGYSDAPENNPHQSTDWEVWKTSINQRVWSALAKTAPFDYVHIHLADGVFEN